MPTPARCGQRSWAIIDLSVQLLLQRGDQARPRVLSRAVAVELAASPFCCRLPCHLMPLVLLLQLTYMETVLAALDQVC